MIRIRNHKYHYRQKNKKVYPITWSIIWMKNVKLVSSGNAVSKNLVRVSHAPLVLNFDGNCDKSSWNRVLQIQKSPHNVWWTSNNVNNYKKCQKETLRSQKAQFRNDGKI